MKKHNLVDDPFKAFIEDVLFKIRALEINVQSLIANITSADSLKDKTKKSNLSKKMSFEKMELANRLNQGIKSEIHRINKKIKAKIKLENSNFKTAKINSKKIIKIKKRSSFVRGKHKYANYTPVFKCNCGDEFEDELLICKNDFCKVKYFHKSCIKDNEDSAKRDWKCELCASIHPPN